MSLDLNNDKFCPCCQYDTFKDKKRLEFSICPICFWEDDPIQLNSINEIGANQVSLIKARVNFEKFGSCEKEMIKNCRKPNNTDNKIIDIKVIELFIKHGSECLWESDSRVTRPKETNEFTDKMFVLIAKYIDLRAPILTGLYSSKLVNKYQIEINEYQNNFTAKALLKLEGLIKK